MSLKYLFFPIVLVVSTVVFWAYVWPEFVSLRANNVSYRFDQGVLREAYDKKAALETLNSQIRESDSGSTLVLNYVPKDRAEEKIIGQINYLASNSGVFLNNIEVLKKNEQSSSTLKAANSTANVASNLKAGNSNVLQSTQITIKVGGDYDKLKLFFSGIQHMPLLNSIKSLNIVSKDKAKDKNNSSTPAVDEKVQTSIEAELVVDFGYLNQARTDESKLASFKAEIDDKTIQDLKEYTSGVIPKINTSDIATGRSNPFLP